jgi:hypothetical protein
MAINHILTYNEIEEHPSKDCPSMSWIPLAKTSLQAQDGLPREKEYPLGQEPATIHPQGDDPTNSPLQPTAFPTSQ